MNTRIAIVFLSLLTSTGCIFLPGWGGGSGGGGGTGGGSGGGLSGDVTVAWTFAGRTCASAGVSTVRINIGGETLQNNGVYSCLTDNYPGIQLNDFGPGTYSYTIDGRGYANEVLYTHSGSFTVNGNVRLDVDLAAVSGAGSAYAYLQWSFPANSVSSNPSCAQAGVTTVYVSIDGAPEYSVACAQGFNTTPGVQTQLLASGTHSIDLTAVDSTGYAYYSKSSTLVTQAGNPTSQSYALNWAVGGAAVAWTLVDGSVTRTCAQAGITNVTVNFEDTATGALLYGNAGDAQLCGSGAANYDFLTPGRYRVIVEGFGSGSSLYTSNTTLGAPEVTVTAGIFTTVNQATSTVMYRVQ